MTLFNFLEALQSVIKTVTKFLGRLGPKLLGCLSCFVDHVDSEACALCQLHQLPVGLERQQRFDFQTGLMRFLT